jgi:hypothetical protein
MVSENIPINLTPIEKSHIVLNTTMKWRAKVIRSQFPITIAEALTIHKSQGQTYMEVCVDLRNSRRITRQQLYVAFSRVTSLSGLYILGEFKPPVERDLNPVVIEMELLRKPRSVD